MKQIKCPVLGNAPLTFAILLGLLFTLKTKKSRQVTSLRVEEHISALKENLSLCFKPKVPCGNLGPV